MQLGVACFSSVCLMSRHLYLHVFTFCCLDEVITVAVSRPSPHLLSLFARCWFVYFSALKQRARLIKEGWQEIQPLGIPAQGASVKKKSLGVFVCGQICFHVSFSICGCLWKPFCIFLY